MFIVRLFSIFNFENIKNVKMSIEFKKNSDVMDQNDIDFRDQRIKIVQRKILQLNHQILC